MRNVGLYDQNLNHRWCLLDIGKLLIKMTRVLMKKKEKLQIILDGRTIIGTRYLFRDEENSLQQIIEYGGLRRQDNPKRRNKNNTSEMLWTARFILADLFEESCLSAKDRAVNIQ